MTTRTVAVPGLIAWAALALAYGVTQFSSSELLGAERALSSEGRIVSLETYGLASHGTARPLIAKSDEGDLYIFWHAEVNDKLRNTSGLPLLPPCPPDPLPGLNARVGVSVLRAGKWRTPSILNVGKVHCYLEFAWCSGKSINLIVRMADRLTHHLSREGDASEWRSILLPLPLECEPVFEGCRAYNGKVHIAAFSRTKLYYLFYDGKQWSRPLVICDEVRFDGLYGYFGPRLTVMENGTVHIVWNTPELPRHVTIEDGKIVGSQDIKLKYPVAEGNDIAIAALSKDKMLMAYRPRKDIISPGALCVMEFQAGQGWTDPEILASDAGLNLGNPQFASFGDVALLAWFHRGAVSSGGFYISAPIVSYMVRNNKGKWSERKPVVELAASPLGPRSVMPGAFFSLWCDPQGVVHMAWGGDGDEDTYYVPLARLAERK